MLSVSNQESQRVQKIIADTGICSRREAEGLVAEGLVTINGKVASLGAKAIPGKDHIKVRGKLLKAPPEKTVIALFKPRGVSTTFSTDGQHHEGGTIYEILAKAKIRDKMIPAGRLDVDAEGILLLTNDGVLAQRLNKSKQEIPRVWSVKIDGKLEEKKIKRLKSGFDIEGRRVKAQSIEETRGSDGKQWYKLTLTDSRNRVIRTLFESVGHPIDKVRRESHAGISLKGLERGQWRYLSKIEVEALCRLVGI